MERRRPEQGQASSTPFEVAFRTATVWVLADRVETVFREDGSTAVATVDEGDPDHIEASWHATVAISVGC